MKIGLVICLTVILATGCTLFDRQERRINYTKKLDTSGESLITDAKQRAIINTRAKVGVGDTVYDAEGVAVGVTDDQVVKNHPHRIICAEPSPDVAQAISAAFTAAGQADSGQNSGAGSIGSSYAASIAQLGERLATVQLLRDKMYRACEAYQNGAISDTSYTLMLARFDKTMASMLASETAAGAFGRNLATLGGSASTGGVDPKKLSDARDAVKTAAKQLQDAATPEAKAQARADLDTAVNALVEIEFLSAVSAAQSGPPAGSGGVPGQINGGPKTINSDAVVRIHTNFIDDDASGTLIDACVVALDRNRAGAPPDPALATAIKNKTQDVAEKIGKAADAEKKARDASDSFQLQRAQGVSGGSEQARLQDEAEKTKKNAADANSELERAKSNLNYLKDLASTPSLGNICAAILKNGTQEQNLLLQLQENKLKARATESNLVLKQILAQGCTEATKDIADKTGRADRYAACISRAQSFVK
jgi:hypothetical protein